MGIDAEIVVKLGRLLDEKERTEISWNLCAAIGANKFYISDGLPTPVYNVESERWHARFQKHGSSEAYIAELRQPERNALHASILADIGPVPQEMRRAFGLTNLDASDGYAPGKVAWQDSPAMLAKDGEWLYEVSVWGRYYGIGYERGDILTYCAIAEWLEANLPGCEVWYGGDSSGVLLEPFTDSVRKALRRHLYSDMGRSYFQEMSFSRSPKSPQPCGLCVADENRFTQFGTGLNYIAVSCAGCGKNFVSRDDGATWALKEGE